MSQSSAVEFQHWIIIIWNASCLPLVHTNTI